MNSLEEEAVVPCKQGEQSISFQNYTNQKTDVGDVSRFPSTTGGLYNSSISEKHGEIAKEGEKEDEDNKLNQSYYSYYDE